MYWFKAYNECASDSVNCFLSGIQYHFSYHDIVVPNGIPAIVPEDLFNEVQEMKAKNKKAPARRKAEDLYTFNYSDDEKNICLSAAERDEAVQMGKRSDFSAVGEPRNR